MTKEEYIEALEGIKDRKLRDEFAKQYRNDSLADKKVLLAKAQASLGMYEGLKAVKDANTVSPLTYVFNESESGLRDLVDPNSPSNWMNMSSKALLDAAIAGGYVKDVPEFAPEWKKREKREQFGKFLNMLARESFDQGRRNAVREFENTKNDPLAWATNNILLAPFPTYVKRAKEQALKGEGFSGSSNPLKLDILNMPAEDLATLGTDIASDAVMGAGAAGIGKTIGRNGLRTYNNVLGSDLAAGVLGGLGFVGNRAKNTDDGVRWYEWITEPAVTGAMNVVATPATIRSAARGAVNVLGLHGAKVGGKGMRNALSYGQKVADEKYAEPALAAMLDELNGTNALPYEKAHVTKETQDAVNNMFDVLNDGVTDSPNKNYSLYDELKQLYESSARDMKLMNENGAATSVADAIPTEGRFRYALDDKIAKLEGDLKHNAGKSSTPEDTWKPTNSAEALFGQEKTIKNLEDNIARFKQAEDLLNNECHGSFEEFAKRKEPGLVAGLSSPDPKVRKSAETRLADKIIHYKGMYETNKYMVEEVWKPRLAEIKSTMYNAPLSQDELKRKIAYLDNFRKMMDNGLIDAKEYLYSKNPGVLQPPTAEYVLNAATSKAPNFELGKKVPQYDLDIMNDYVRNSVTGNNVQLDNGLADKLKELVDKYPEFARYVGTQRQVPTKGASFSNWNALGTENPDIPGLTIALGHEVPEGGMRVYGTKALDGLTGGYKHLARDVLGDMVKPAVVHNKVMQYDKPDNSLEALEVKIAKLRETKADALDAALNWKYNPRLDESKQLTAEERNLVNQYRAAKLDAAMNGR